MQTNNDNKDFQELKKEPISADITKTGNEIILTQKKKEEKEEEEENKGKKLIKVIKEEEVTNLEEKNTSKIEEAGEDKVEDDEEGESISLTFEEASRVMKFLASAVPSEDFKTSIRNKLKDENGNKELSQIFDSEGNIKIKAVGEMSEAAKTFFNESNEGKKILRAINVLKTIFVALSGESVKFSNKNLGKTLFSILKGWGVGDKPNDKTVIEVSKILENIKSLGGSELLDEGSSKAGQGSTKYNEIVSDYNITKQQLKSDNNYVGDFINRNNALGRLLCKKLEFSETHKLGMLENAIVDRSLDETTLNKVEAILLETTKSEQQISKEVQEKILSKRGELDEKTTSKDHVWSGVYNKFFSSYSVSAKTLQKIVSENGAITFNVFLINDEEFKVAMKAFEDIYQKSSDAVFGNLLKTIKILRICANQKNNQTAKELKDYTETHKQTEISTLLNHNFFLSLVSNAELQDDSNNLSDDRNIIKYVVGKFEFSKEDIEDIKKLGVEKGAIIHDGEIFYELEEDIVNSETRSDRIDKYKSIVMKPDSNNKNMAIIEILSSLGKIKLNVGLTKTLDHQSMKISFDQKEFKDYKSQVLQRINKKMIGTHNLLEGTTSSEISKIANGMGNKYQEQTAEQMLDECVNIITVIRLFNQYNPEVKINSIRNLTFYPIDELKKNLLFNSIVKQFSQPTPALNRLLQLVMDTTSIKAKQSETQKMLESAVVDQSLSKETLDKVVDLFTTISPSQKIDGDDDKVNKEILSRSKELDEKTTSKIPVLNWFYDAIFSSYSDSAETLQKIVSKDGAITFNVFLINDEEFKVAMKAFEDIYQKSNGAVFDNLLKMIKILRICANQNDNEMAKKFKNYAKTYEQTEISTLLNDYHFFLNFIPDNKIEDSGNPHGLESNFSAVRLFFSNFKFSKEEIDDVNKLVSPEEEKTEDKKENEENKEINEKKEDKTEENKEEKKEEKTEENKEEKTEEKKGEKEVEKKDEEDNNNMNNSMDDVDKFGNNGKLRYTLNKNTSDQFNNNKQNEQISGSAASTNNTTRIDSLSSQLIGTEQSKEKQSEESHVLRRIGVILLGFVISALFAAAVTFALAAIPGVGPVIGGILGKAFVDAATLSIGSGVSLGWVAGGIGALFAFISGVLFVKKLCSPECVEESKKVEEDNDKEEEVKEGDKNVGHDRVTSLLQENHENSLEMNNTQLSKRPSSEVKPLSLKSTTKLKESQEDENEEYI